MPELPDITIYIEALDRRITGRTVEAVRVTSPFVMRTYDPPIRAIEGRTVRGLRRLGKQIVWELDGDLMLVFHLMIGGRLHWRATTARGVGKTALAAFDFAGGTLLFTEAAMHKRASLHLVRGDEALAAFDRGGLDVLLATVARFRDRVTRENHTLKRALTDPDLLSGIGNAYSDEILHRARLSPFKQTRALTDEEIARLYAVTRATLIEWTERLRAATGDRFPEKVTAFHEQMAVHGRYGQPCPVCRTPVQRIVHGEQETNYCPECQTGGRLLADRALSRLLKQDWPRSIDELEARRTARRSAMNAARAGAFDRTLPSRGE